MTTQLLQLFQSHIAQITTKDLARALDPGPWEKYGLPGMVIFALFIAIALVMWISRKFQVEQQLEHRDERTLLINMHREERKEWKDADNRRHEDTMKQTDRLHATVERLTSAIEGMNRAR